jgi:hypothetical protein
MSKIFTITDYNFPVFYGDTIVLNEPDENNPHILSPYRTFKEGPYKYLVYHVTTRGKTLREFIAEVNKKPERRSFRASFKKQDHVRMNPVDILLKLIDACEDLLNTNRLLSQSHINPDLIWIDYDANNNITLRLLDIMDYDVAKEDVNETMYLSPELLGKRNHLMYVKSSNLLETHPQVQKRSSLNRYDTRPSTLSSVYSIGLVFYFIVHNSDPYEGSRIHVEERPRLTGTSPLYSKIIWIATNHNPKERPTLKEFREIITPLRNPETSLCC